MTEAPDTALLEQLARQSGIERELPAPGLDEYMLTLAEALAEWLRSSFGPVGRLLAAHPVMLELLTRGLLVALVLAIGVALLRGLRSRRAAAAVEAPRLATGAAPAPERDREAWRAELDARLNRGDVPAALEALWWWFARSLLGARALGCQTTGELVAQAGRADLGALSDALDRLCYGSARPTPAELRAWLRRAEGTLPA